ncbi:MAG: T9SS type A sorting domain-containing protein [Cytophagales bacterium]|nr:T9SS type A sorting domain-containing protein [Cytophagales bacterium]
MKKIIIIVDILLIIIAVKTIGQTIYFDKTFNYDGQANYGVTNVLLEKDTSYLALRTSWDPINGDAQIIFFKIDKFGDSLWSKFFGQPGFNYTGVKLLKTNDSNYAFCGTKYDLSVGWGMFGNTILYKLNSVGDTIWTKEYVTTDTKDVCTAGKITEDGCFLLVSSIVDSLNSDANIRLMKTDSIGNVEWSKMYGGPNYEGIGSIIIAPDGGYYLLGWTRSWGGTDMDIYLIRTDSVGDLLWQKTYGVVVYNEAGSEIISTQDGNYIICGQKEISSVDWVGSLTKIDSSGNILWDKIYGVPKPISYTEHFWAVKELKNGDLIAVGGSDFTVSGDNDNAGWVVKTTSAGDSLWSRLYNRSQYLEIFYDVELTTDGGFILAGQTGGWNITGNPSQDGWLLKLDSMGYHTPDTNCHEIYPEPDATYTQSHDTVDIKDTLYVKFINYDATVTLWEWDFGDGTTPGNVPNPFHFYDSAGTFTVILIAHKGTCTDTFASTVTVVNATGIGSLSSVDKYMLNIFPNPLNEFTTISAYLSESTKSGEILIYDVPGKIIKAYSLQKGSNHIKINANELKPGIFFITLFADNERVVTKKMVICQ